VILSLLVILQIRKKRRYQISIVCQKKKISFLESKNDIYYICIILYSLEDFIIQNIFLFFSKSFYCIPHSL
jgi:hypothetical protein